MKLQIYYSKDGSRAEELILDLYENGIARVSSWNSNDALRRQVYRRLPSVMCFFPGKAMSIESKQDVNYTELRAHLTRDFSRDNLGGSPDKIEF